MKKLIYVMDPQCGWCYGNSTNITSIQKEFSVYFDFEILVGGMWLDANAPVGGVELSQFIKSNSKNLILKTGASISASFYTLAENSNYSFSSLEPSAAITLIKTIHPEIVFQFSQELQSTIFINGKRLDKLESYLPILKLLNLDETYFTKHWMTESNLEDTRKEFQKASTLCQGFPTLLLKENGSFQTLSSGYFDKSVMADFLKSII